MIDEKSTRRGLLGFLAGIASFFTFGLGKRAVANSGHLMADTRVRLAKAFTTFEFYDDAHAPEQKAIAILTEPRPKSVIFKGVFEGRPCHFLPVAVNGESGFIPIYKAIDAEFVDDEPRTPPSPMFVRGIDGNVGSACTAPNAILNIQPTKGL